MSKEIKMPQLSDTMDSGKILSWYKKEGDEISRGDILAEVETDKANLEIESFDEGVLLKIVTPENEAANVGQTIAIIGKAGETVPDVSSNGASPQQETQPEPAKEVAPPPAAEEPQSTPQPAPSPTPTQAATQNVTQTASSDHVKASPLAKKIAKERNIDLNSIFGSGPNGRIIKKDLEGNVAPAPAQATQQPQPSIKSKPRATTTPVTQKPSGTKGNMGSLSGQFVQLSKMRATIAKRMQESMQQSPHFYMTSTINMREAKKLREQLKIKADFKGLSLNHFIIKAAAYALERVPEINSTLVGEQVFYPDEVNVGVITAIEGGLLIPVIHQTNNMSLQDVAVETRAAISRAREGKPTTEDLSGGTFSISNMGMYDVENFTAIINPGQGAILAVSSMKEKAIVEDGEIVAGLLMNVTLSVDHRIIDGVTAGIFLKHFKEALETPAFLLVY